MFYFITTVSYQRRLSFREYINVAVFSLYSEVEWTQTVNRVFCKLVRLLHNGAGYVLFKFTISTNENAVCHGRNDIHSFCWRPSTSRLVMLIACPSNSATCTCDTILSSRALGWLQGPSFTPAIAWLERNYEYMGHVEDLITLPAVAPDMRNPVTEARECARQLMQ